MSSIPPPRKCGTEDDPLTAVIQSMKDELAEHNRPRRVLFVEDEEWMRELFGRWAERFNCEVTYAATGDEGLRLALRGLFDLIILDIALPGLSGIEVFREIRKVLGDQPPVTFFTGMLDDEQATQIEKTGFAAFIRKPHQFNERFITSLFHTFRIFKKAETAIE